MALMILLAAGLLSLAGAVLLTLRTRVAGPVGPLADPGTARFLRAQLAWRAVALALGTLAATAATGLDALGRGMLVAPPLFAAVVLLGVLAAQLTVHAPRQGTRTASITVRRITTYLPHRLTRAVAAAGITLAALLTLTTALGSPDDQGRAGRALSAVCPVGGGSPVRARTLTSLLTPMTSGALSTRGPWLGAYYSVPLAVAVLVGVAAALLTLGRVARRPPVGDPASSSPAQEESLRAGSARAVVGACGMLICTPLLVVGPITAAGLLGVCHPAWWTVMAGILLALTPAWLGLLAVSTVAALSPGGAARPTRRTPIAPSGPCGPAAPAAPAAPAGPTHG